MNNETKALVKPETGKDLISLFENHAMAAQRIMDIALTNTLPSDWMNYGGKAWLDGPGSERIARALGITIKDWKYERLDLKDDEGEHYYIISTGKVGHEPSNLWVDAIGVCWSRKPFWYKHGDDTRHIGEINMGNIIKDSYTDLRRTGVNILLGLRGLPWDYLKKHGFTPEKAQQVQYQEGKQGGKKRSTRPAQQNNAIASPNQISILAKSACRKVIGTSEGDILQTLPENLTSAQYQELVNYSTMNPGDIELEDWKNKVREVTG